VSAARIAAGAVLTVRVAYGAALIAAPERLARRWLGPASEGGPTQVPLRGLGTREVVLHLGALAALARGRRLWPWLAASIAGDVTDIAATAAAARELPPGAARATLLVAGASALASAAVGAAADR
jgi:hypothetical protein